MFARRCQYQKNTLVYITDSEYKGIKTYIEQDATLLKIIYDYKQEWTADDESNNQLAFIPPPTLTSIWKSKCAN